MSTTKPVEEVGARKHEENGVAYKGAPTILSSKLGDRLARLLDEHAKGQQIIAGLEQRLEEARGQAQRIDGAIRVLQEIIAEERAG